jgi:anti-sigma B factor antagonist
VERSSGAAPPLSSGRSGGPEHGQLLTLRIEPAGSNASIVSLVGELDLSTVPRVEEQLFQELRSKAGVVFDLTALSFIDSSGIALLIHAFSADNKGAVLNTVITEGSQVDRVFRLAGIDRALPLFTERAGALEALNGAASD